MTDGAGRGVLTIAHGSRRYLRMAQALARSLRRHAPGLSLAVVTDAPGSHLLDLFDARLRFEPGYGRGHAQKLNIDRYSPFDETLYIDVDSLVVDPLDEVWPLFAHTAVGVVGGSTRAGWWFGDIGALCTRLGVGEIPRFNGGFVFVRRSAEATAVFETARELMGRYAELGLQPMRSGAPNDEPVLACALALHHVAGITDGGRSSRTPIGIRGPLRIDVLGGGAAFTKEGVPVCPAVVHFCGWRSRGFHYQREALKLRLVDGLGLPPAATARAVSLVANPPYTLAAAVFRPPLRALERWRRTRGTTR
jgi:hypothetical protein